jgi:hypothetical protein
MRVVWRGEPEPPRQPIGTSDAVYRSERSHASGVPNPDPKPSRPPLLDPDTLERARRAADGYSASEKAQYARRCKKLPRDAVSVILRRRRQTEEDNDLLCAIAGIREPDMVAALGAVIPWKIPSEEVSQM